jgi:hypothetical protein
MIFFFMSVIDAVINGLQNKFPRLVLMSNVGLPIGTNQDKKISNRLILIELWHQEKR